MKFQLNENELRKANEFIDMCNLIEDYTCSSVQTKRRLTFSYIFSKGSGIGQASVIECEELQIGINLTDYESW